MDANQLGSDAVLLALGADGALDKINRIQFATDRCSSWSACMP
jgi:hypothetical protein